MSSPFFVFYILWIIALKGRKPNALMYKSIYEKCIGEQNYQNLTTINNHNIAVFQNATQCISEKKRELEESVKENTKVLENIGRCVVIFHIFMVFYRHQ